MGAARRGQRHRGAVRGAGAPGTLRLPGRQHQGCDRPRGHAGGHPGRPGLVGGAAGGRRQRERHRGALLQRSRLAQRHRRLLPAALRRARHAGQPPAARQRAARGRFRSQRGRSGSAAPAGRARLLPRRGHGGQGRRRPGLRPRGHPARAADEGRPRAGRPWAGRPWAGRPWAGRPWAGRPWAGRPRAGRPWAGRPRVAPTARRACGYGRPAGRLCTPDAIGRPRVAPAAWHACGYGRPAVAPPRGAGDGRPRIGREGPGDIGPGRGPGSAQLITGPPALVHAPRRPHEHLHLSPGRGAHRPRVSRPPARAKCWFPT